tara:strand:+ start:435 stop:626 length:192 start_codon:yes stop_codon:yes gene_type:complete
MKPPAKRKPSLGSGKRFKRLVKELKKNPKNKTPEKLAAFIGRKKYGKKFAKMAAKGRQRKRRS